MHKKLLNESGLDLHVHAVGERASRTLLDGVEIGRKELGEAYRVKVTCAHLEMILGYTINGAKQLGSLTD